MLENVTTPDQADSSSLLTLGGVHSRRSFLKKAGLGTAAVAAAWAVPQVTSVGAQRAYAAVTGPCIETITDFNQFKAGDVITNQIAGINVKAVGGHGDEAMIFDTENYTGGDSDLSWPGGEYGKVLIVQENDDGVPDDAVGGSLTFEFVANPVSISYVTLLDIEEDGTKIDLFSDLACTALIKSEDVTPTGNGGVAVTDMNALGGDVRCMRVTFTGSGAVAKFVCPCP